MNESMSGTKATVRAFYPSHYPRDIGQYLLSVRSLALTLCVPPNYLEVDTLYIPYVYGVNVAMNFLHPHHMSVIHYNL